MADAAKPETVCVNRWELHIGNAWIMIHVRAPADRNNHTPARFKLVQLALTRLGFAIDRIEKRYQQEVERAKAAGEWE